MNTHNTPPIPFSLTPGELMSPTFQRLKAHWQEELDAARRENDADMDPVKTARLRGRIDQLKKNLALENPMERLDLPPGLNTA